MTYSKFPNRVFYTTGIVTHVGFDAQGYRRAILDVELLSRCDEIVVTGGSTFGWIAAMKMLKLPFYVIGASSMEKCLRAELSNPPSNQFGKEKKKKIYSPK